MNNFEFDEWKKDNKFIYYTFSTDKEPKWQILKFKKFKSLNLNGYIFFGVIARDLGCFYCREKNGIMHTWINLDAFYSSVNYDIDEDYIIKDAFKFNRNEWIKNKRNQKIKRIINV